MHFTIHVIHAILINTMRLPGYALLTFGRSLLVSLGLILFELVIIPFALLFDLWAMKWRRRGLPIMEWDFEPMTKIKKFSFTPRTSDIPSEIFKWKECAHLRKNIIKTLKNNQWYEADLLCIKFLKKEFREGPESAGPLLIHFVESIGRSIAVTRYLQEKGFLKDLSGKEVKSFYFQRRILVLFQMIGFEGAFILDLLARGVRRRGVMILSDDVPHITRLPEGKSLS